MNYAVRPTTFADVTSLFEQLCKDVCAKMLRRTCQCTSVRITVLERQPDAPVQTTKFLGCGRCNEYHWILKPLRPLRGEEYAAMTELCASALSNIVLDHNQITTVDCNAEAGDGLHPPHPPPPQAVVPPLTTSGEAKRIALADFRGVGVQVSGIVSTAVSIVKKAHQVSLAEVLMRQKQHQQSNAKRDAVVIEATQQPPPRQRHVPHDEMDCIEVMDTPATPLGPGPGGAVGVVGGNATSDEVPVFSIASSRGSVCITSAPGESPTKRIGEEIVGATRQTVDLSHGHDCNERGDVYELEDDSVWMAHSILSIDDDRPTESLDAPAVKGLSSGANGTANSPQPKESYCADVLIRRAAELLAPPESLRVDSLLGSPDLPQGHPTASTAPYSIEGLLRGAAAAKDLYTLRTILRMTLTAVAECGDSVGGGIGSGGAQRRAALIATFAERLLDLSDRLAEQVMATAPQSAQTTSPIVPRFHLS